MKLYPERAMNNLTMVSLKFILKWKLLFLRWNNKWSFIKDPCIMYLRTLRHWAYAPNTKTLLRSLNINLDSHKTFCFPFILLFVLNIWTFENVLLQNKNIPEVRISRWIIILRFSCHFVPFISSLEPLKSRNTHKIVQMSHQLDLQR